jgi:septal ring factor EnvC (AmiA/AmiB activator)
VDPILARIAALVLAALLAGAAAARAEPPKAPIAAAELGSLREQAVAAAQTAQEEERKVAGLAHGLDLLRREAEGRQRGLDESRPEQVELLGILERLARTPPDSVALGSEPPLDRARGQMLIAATLPELRAEAHALAEEIDRVAALRGEIGGKEAELDREREALGKQHANLAEMAARCVVLSRKLAPEDADSEKRLAKLGREAGDLTELIKRADAEADRREKDLLSRATEDPPKGKGNSPAPGTADPSRPRNLRAFDAEHTRLTMPVAGAIVSGFGAEDLPGKPSQGLALSAMRGASVVAPFDAQVVYAGPFRGYGPSLILRHGGGYYSLLAGLGRLDVANGQWVLAGEPVGALADVSGDGSGGRLYIELRRDGRPIDPQSWLANTDQGTGRSGQSGEQRVRE